tara:strand:- start:3665 stop:4084 length:420 start_codon:yes stop_codon:yes gene_type:complete
MKQRYISYNLLDLEKIAYSILRKTQGMKKFIFIGDMGVGKTTLIKELSLQLGVNDTITSPTFSIINEYNSIKDLKVYHFDLYRIKDENEALDFGIEEYLYSDDYCFIEWPERVSGLINSNVVEIKIKLERQNRIIDISL